MAASSRSNIFLILLSIGLSIALLFAMRSCTDRGQQLEDRDSYILASRDTIRFLSDSSVAQKKALQAGADLFKTIVKDRDDLQRALAAAELKAKHVGAFTTVVTGSTIKPGRDSIIIRIADSLPCPNFGMIPFNVDSPYYSIEGMIGNEQVVITGLQFPDSLFLITATKRHFFKQDEIIVSAQHSNKYLRVKGLENFTIRQPRKWWQAKWVPFAAGLAGGYFLFKN